MVAQSKGASKIIGSWNMEIVISVLLSMVAIIAIYTARSFPGTGSPTDIGAGAFPVAYSSILIVLCVLLISVNLGKHKNNSAVLDTGFMAGAKANEDKPNYRRTFAGIVASVLVVWTIDYLGYALTGVIYMSFVMWLLDFRHKLWNPLLAILITGIIYFTFSSALNVPLPVGDLFY